MIYCYPRLIGHDFLLFRVLGRGLGNLLFPWARALVHAQANGQQLISPTWPQLRISPWLRREADARLYPRLFKRLPEALSGPGRIATLLVAPRVPEGDAAVARDGDVIEFRGMQGLFEPILDAHALVKARLLRMTRSRHLCGLDFDFRDSVCLHVRLGDFGSAASDDDLRRGKWNTRIPIRWYQDMLRGVRAQRGADLQAYVFSDGTDRELGPLLSMLRCRRLGFGSAIADMLALSRSRFLIASGSTFSAWASYIGRMPVVWFPGQLRTRLYRDGVFEDEAKDAAQLALALASRCGDTGH
ncbi:hypothetical protein [Cognatiluteimonas profundi]|uniref:hypothetical protein n=1 Tax=Cognatiluteimonas profundi TaxID=2594501 RepID=UPI00131BE46A|nr:hypothetical protein [Lysobacter profundi]